MELNKYKLGELIEQVNEKNKDNQFTLDNVRGLSIQKIFIPTKANMKNVPLHRYLLVSPDDFVYVPTTSRNSNKITLAHNTEEETYIVSSSYTVFRVSKPDLLSSDYLFMYFNRPEFDRYARYHSWGTARETFDFSDLCDMEIELPPIEIQQKYVDIYNALLENLEAYEKGTEDLKLVCDGYIEDLRKHINTEPIKEYIEQINERNKDNSITNVQGISVYKKFRKPTSKVDRTKLTNYKIVRPKQIAFVQTTHNEKVLAFALNNTDEDILVSSVNEVFKADEKKLLSGYLAMWLSRKELDRYARFHSWGTARETFNWEDMQNIKIPIPDIETQQAIVDIYNVYIERQEIAEKIKQELKNICPILIAGSLQNNVQDR